MDGEDAAFVERLRRRDETAFNELVLQHQAAVYRLLLRMLGNPAEAEDVAQEVFVSVFRSIDSFRGDCAMSTWLYRIAQNQAKNRIKYLARRRAETRPTRHDQDGTPGVVAEAPPAARPDRSVEAQEAETHLDRALAELDDEQRLLITLRDLEHLSYEDIATVANLPLGTVKSRLHRARLALAQRFAALQEGRR